VYDESYGRVLSCSDPLGDVVDVDERNDDLYGYREHADDPPAAGLTVMPVKFVGDRGAYGDFLGSLGLRPRDDEDGYVASYVGPGRAGGVLLHPPADGEPPFMSRAVRLSFETAEPLRTVADRLASAGFAADLVEESFGPVLHTVDADDLRLEVHPAPAAAA
jgi:hypothetical protein